MKLAQHSVSRMLRLGSAAIVINALTACGGGSGTSPSANINGTAAIGAPLAGATIQLTCKNGATTTTTNAAGAYSATFAFDAPCVLTGTGGGTVLHSFAAGSGTYNLTSLTELLVNYLAAQLGTTANGLLTGIASNTAFQSALANSTVILNAEAAVAQIIKNTYGITLSSSAFLTTAFVTGQPGPDADLDKLQSAGALSASGEPAATLLQKTITAGAANPIKSGGGGATGGTGGTGGT